MTNTYYIKSAGQTHGPCTLDQVREMTYAGQIHAEALYLDQIADEWKPLRELLDPTGAAHAPSSNLPAPATAPIAPAAQLTPEVTPEILPLATQRNLFYENYATYLRSQKLSSVATRKADPGINSGYTKTEYATVAATAIATIAAIGVVPGLDALAYSLGSLRTLPEQLLAQIEAEFAPMAGYNPILLYSDRYGMLRVNVSIEADHLSDAELVAAAKAFDTCLLAIRKYLPYRRILLFIKQTTSSISGTLSYIFFDPAKAANFRDNIQKRCSMGHIVKRVDLNARTIDVQQKTVRTHSWLPILAARPDRKMVEMLFPAS